MVTLEQIRQKTIEAIKQSGLTQTELARRLGIGQQTISEYIRGKSMPALDTFANICIILDIDPADILCTNESGNKSTHISNSFNNNSGSINFKA